MADPTRRPGAGPLTEVHRPGFSTASEGNRSSSPEIAPNVIRAGVYPNNTKIPIYPWTIQEAQIIRRVDAGSLRRSDPMSVLHKERQLNAAQRRALELLADAGEQGCTGARLFNHGFTVGMLADLVWSGLATGHRGTVRVGHRKIKVARLRITDAGRRALEG
jgi:hypothetical protein